MFFSDQKETSVIADFVIDIQGVPAKANLHF